MSNRAQKPPNLNLLAATNSGPKPADFPLGSAKSRAAARAILEEHQAEQRRIEQAVNDRLTPFQMAWCEDYTGLKRRIAAGLAAVAEERARIFQHSLPTPEEIRHWRAVAREVDRITDGRAFYLRMYDTAEWDRFEKIAEENLGLKPLPPND